MHGSWITVTFCFSLTCHRLCYIFTWVFSIAFFEVQAHHRTTLFLQPSPFLVSFCPSLAGQTNGYISSQCGTKAYPLLEQQTSHVKHICTQFIHYAILVRKQMRLSINKNIYRLWFCNFCWINKCLKSDTAVLAPLHKRRTREDESGLTKVICLSVFIFISRDFKHLKWNKLP